MCKKCFNCRILYLLKTGLSFLPSRITMKAALEKKTETLKMSRTMKIASYTLRLQHQQTVQHICTHIRSTRKCSVVSLPKSMSI